jgi:hypothetical protein
MRRVDLRAFQPSAAWLAKANAANDELSTKGTHEERVAFMKAKSSIWRELREELIGQFGNKCWFTDAPEFVARLDVEHFRPKAKSLDRKGKPYQGYWWLAFDWENYRLCGQIPNREEKKSWFPLMPRSFRATMAADDWRLEEPAFLDPSKPGDVALVAYAEDGGVHAKPGADRRESYRVRVTDSLLGLSRVPAVVEERQKIWKHCRLLVRDFMTLKVQEKRGGANPVLSSQQDDVLRRLLAMTRSQEAFASVARSCLRQSPEKWAVDLLTLLD